MRRLGFTPLLNSVLSSRCCAGGAGLGSLVEVCFLATLEAPGGNEWVSARELESEQIENSAG